MKKNNSFAEYINNGFYRSILIRSFCFDSIFLIFGFGSSFWMIFIRSSTVDTINSFASTLIGRRKSVTCCTIRKSIWSGFNIWACCLAWLRGRRWSHARFSLKLTKWLLITLNDLIWPLLNSPFLVDYSDYFVQSYNEFRFHLSSVSIFSNQLAWPESEDGSFVWPTFFQIHDFFKRIMQLTPPTLK